MLGWRFGPYLIELMGSRQRCKDILSSSPEIAIFTKIDRFRKRLDDGFMDILTDIGSLGLSQHAKLGCISCMLSRVVEMLVAQAGPATSPAPSSSTAATTSRASPPHTS